MALRVPPIRQSSKHLPFGDQQNSAFYGRDILSVKQFDRADLEYIFGVAEEMQEMVRRVAPKKVYTLHGFAVDFARTLRKLGFEAQALDEDEQLLMEIG